ncbi:RodZ domain-containing protein [Salinicola aestuarinus]|uniref:RodZ domain-containing protein n=1 Tax=Salinicola aestuarinus TaxID=1949082 RepID=UPI000DA14B8C|nr:RodZ domain-containing protein [Salinicola aestuarinus]
MSEMDEQQRNAQAASDGSQELAGAMLRRERERQGLSLDEVALQLNLRPVVVAGLEEERFDQVPVAAYRRGYMRAYARLLGMDDAAIVRAFDAAHGRADIDRKLSPVNTTRQPSRAGAWVFRLFTLLVLVGLVSLTLLWWQSREGNDALGGGDDPISVDARDGQNANTDLEPNTDTALPPVPNPQDTPASDTPAASVDDDIEGTDGGVSSNAEIDTPSVDARQAEQVADAAVTPDTAVEDDQTAADGDGDTGAAETDDNTLKLSFDGESWTQIIDATGSTVFSALQPAGSEATVTGEPPFRMTIGESAMVTLRYRGEEIDLDQYTSGNVARFTLGD